MLHEARSRNALVRCRFSDDLEISDDHISPMRKPCSPLAGPLLFLYFSFFFPMPKSLGHELKHFNCQPFCSLINSFVDGASCSAGQ